MAIEALIKNIGLAATSPYAFVAYILVVLAWVYVVSSQARLKKIAETLDKLPEEQRADLLAKEYSTFPKSGLSAEQWLRARKLHLLFLGFIAVLLVITVLLTIAITGEQEFQRSKVAKTTDWQMFLYTVGVFFKQQGEPQERSCGSSEGFEPLKAIRGEPIRFAIAVRLVIDNIFRKHQDMIYPVGLSTTWTPGVVHTIYDGIDVQETRESFGPKFSRDLSRQVTLSAPTSIGRHYILVMSGAVLHARQLFYASVETSDHAGTIWRLDYKYFEHHECTGYLNHTLRHAGNRREKVNYPFLAIPVDVVQ